MASAIQAAYEVLNAQLKGTNDPVLGQVQALSVASSKLSKPYTVFFWAGGGRLLSVPSRDHTRYTISVKTVALEMAEAVAGQAAITDLLHNSGVQDINPRLPTNATWQVLTVTEDRMIWLEEKFENALSIYHAGHQYEWLMERK